MSIYYATVWPQPPPHPDTLTAGDVTSGRTNHSPRADDVILRQNVKVMAINVDRDERCPLRLLGKSLLIWG